MEICPAKFDEGLDQHFNDFSRIWEHLFRTVRSQIITSNQAHLHHIIHSVLAMRKTGLQKLVIHLFVFTKIFNLHLHGKIVIDHIREIITQRDDRINRAVLCIHDQITPKCISNFSIATYHAHRGMTTANNVDQKPLAMTIPATHIGIVTKGTGKKLIFTVLRSVIFNPKTF